MEQSHWIALTILLLVLFRRYVALGPLGATYRRFCHWIVGSNRKWPYGTFEKLALVAPFTIFSILEFRSWLAFGLLLIAIGFAWFATSLKAVSEAMDQSDTVDRLQGDLKSAQIQMREMEKASTRHRTLLRDAIEHRLEEKSRFRNNERTSVYLLMDDEGGQYSYYILIARFSHHHDFRKSKSLHKELSSKFGVLGAGHNSPNGFCWEIPDVGGDEELWYEEIWKRFRVPKALVKTISMPCDTICLRRIRGMTQTLGLVVVESQDKDHDLMKLAADRLSNDKELAFLIQCYRDEYLSGQRPLANKEVRKWEADISIEQKNFSNSTLIA